MRETQPTPLLWTTATATKLVCLEPPAMTTDEDEAISFVFLRHRRCPSVQPEGHHHWNQLCHRYHQKQDLDDAARGRALSAECNSVVSRIQNLVSTEFLNSLRSPGVPENELKLKLNCLCMVTRKISVQDWLMNNTKVVVREIG